MSIMLINLLNFNEFNIITTFWLTICNYRKDQRKEVLAS